MRSILRVALVLVVVLLAILFSILWTTRPHARHTSQDELSDLLDPASMPVLAGTDGKLEVVVKARLPRPRNSAWSERHLAARLGLDPEKSGFLEVLVLNISPEPLFVDLAALKLKTAAGSPIRARSLRGLAVPWPSLESLLAAFSPKAARPLKPGMLRRGLVAVPRGLDLGLVTAARLGTLKLFPCGAGTESLEAYLSEPRRPMLLAVLDQAGQERLGLAQRAHPR